MESNNEGWVQISHHGMALCMDSPVFDSDFQPLLGAFLKPPALRVVMTASFIQGVERDAFDDSILIQSAVIRQIEIIGEATKRLSDELRQQYADSF